MDILFAGLHMVGDHSIFVDVWMLPRQKERKYLEPANILQGAWPPVTRDERECGGTGWKQLPSATLTASALLSEPRH